ncbi:putative ribosomal protein ymr-31 protein [Zalerion maritima]|uniref:Ribosomal protein ymr-31 protein n=1 Tax=Zalerion maritima TaxID=339359 RepID=A0AAD5RL19_9PEZI|nr:putative ribosomal protein ymr-31 protein [Zalerion maritima]
MNATKVLRQATAHAERMPSIRFVGKRPIPEHIDHTPKPHPASPTGALPANFAKHGSHTSFSSYRDHAQQFGPLRKTIHTANIGSTPGAALGDVSPPKGQYFDRHHLPGKFRRTAISVDEMEALESGGASMVA